MMCYKDRSYCIAPCSVKDCDRLFTKEIQEAAEQWWKGPNAPIAIADLSSTCKEYQPTKKDSNGN